MQREYRSKLYESDISVENTKHYIRVTVSIVSADWLADGPDAVVYCSIGVHCDGTELPTGPVGSNGSADTIVSQSVSK